MSLVTSTYSAKDTTGRQSGRQTQTLRRRLAESLRRETAEERRSCDPDMKKGKRENGRRAPVVMSEPEFD